MRRDVILTMVEEIYTIIIGVIVYTPLFPRPFMVYWRDGIDGNDGTVKPSSKWNRGPIPSTISPTVNSSRPVPSRRGNIPLPSRPVDKTCPNRLVPSSKKTYTVPSRRDKLYLPSRPVVTMFTYLPVPSWQFLFTVPSRRGNSHPPSRPVPSRQLYFYYFTVPSLLSIFSCQTCQNSTVPFRLEYYQPWKALIIWN